MRTSFFKKNGSPGYRTKSGIVFVVLSVLAVAVWGRMRCLRSRSSRTIVVTDFTRAHEISVRRPPYPHTGAVWVLYEGAISTNASLEVMSNAGRPSVITLQAGQVAGVFGGREHWDREFSVRLLPCEPLEGALKITAVCGRGFTGEERKWFRKLYAIEQQGRRDGSRPTHSWKKGE